MQLLVQFIVLPAFLFIVPDWSMAIEVPPLSAPVVDQAQLLSSSFERKMNGVLKDLQQKGGPQIAILTVKDLEGETIEQASIQVADQWKLGSEKEDNGVLILLSQKQKRARIEVGQGLEGDLTDFESSRILNQIMLPLFKAGDFDSGMYLGVARIAQVTAPEINIDQLFATGAGEFQPRKRTEDRGTNWFAILMFIAAFILFIRHPRLFLLLAMGSMMGGGRRGYGGGGFGGGFRGGGGGFSGGGASGGW